MEICHEMCYTGKKSKQKRKKHLAPSAPLRCATASAEGRLPLERYGFMNTNRENTVGTVAEVEVKSPFLLWLDNFWYHYKWHTLIALFLVFAITVCSVQMCQKQDYDVFVVYAGAHDIERRSSSVSEYEKVYEHLRAVCRDYDGDGRVSPSFLALFLPSNEEIEKINAMEGYEVNTAVVADNAEIFSSNIVYSDYYVYLISPSVYETYRTVSGVEMFVPLAAYAGESEVTYYADDAVLLSSTAFGQQIGFERFPEDTLICLRILTDLQGKKQDNVKKYERAEDMIRSILTLGA